MKDEQLRSSLVFDTISLKHISLLTQSVVLEDSQASASQDKMIFNTKKKHTRLCSANYSMSLLSLWQKMKCTKYSQWESFLKSSFYEWEIMKNYTLLNRHSISVITAMHRLTDSKNKIIKIIIWTSRPSPHMLKAQPNVQLMSI